MHGLSRSNNAACGLPNAFYNNTPHTSMDNSSYCCVSYTIYTCHPPHWGMNHHVRQNHHNGCIQHIVLASYVMCDYQHLPFCMPGCLSKYYISSCIHKIHEALAQNIPATYKLGSPVLIHLLATGLNVTIKSLEFHPVTRLRRALIKCGRSSNVLSS
jgi:hypothetical protein